MRVITIAGHASRGVALAMAVTLAAGCEAEPDTADQADAPANDAAQAGAGDAAEAGAAGDAVATPGEVPARFRGSFAADPSACSASGNPTQLTLEAGAIHFHESSGPVTAVSGGASDLAITAELTGEGETREATYRFSLSDDGNTLTDLDGGLRRVRCSG